MSLLLLRDYGYLYAWLSQVHFMKGHGERSSKYHASDLRSDSYSVTASTVPPRRTLTNQNINWEQWSGIFFMKASKSLTWIHNQLLCIIYTLEIQSLWMMANYHYIYKFLLKFSLKIVLQIFVRGRQHSTFLLGF